MITKVYCCTSCLTIKYGVLLKYLPGSYFTRLNLILQYVQNNKSADNDWFRLESDKTGTKWFGKCWYVHNLLKYEFDLEFDVSIIYNFL